MIAKRQKVDEMETGEEAVLFNSDTLSNIISYLLSLDLLNLGLTCKRFGVSDDKQAKEVASFSDGVIVGSAIIKVIEKNLKNKKRIVAEVGKLAAQIAKAVHKAA